jgi:hypothetical protein
MHLRTERAIYTTGSVDPQAIALLLKERDVEIGLEWSDHHYDPAHNHSHSCHICGGCSKASDLSHVKATFGHVSDCRRQHTCGMVGLGVYKMYDLDG